MVDERISRAIDNDHTAAIKVTSDGRKISRKKNGSMFASQNALFSCTICKKVFKSHHLYRKHLKNHSDKSYICPICNKAFVHKHYLHNHMSVHNLGKNAQYSCHLCPKRFSQKGNLSQHLKFHSIKKPFVCEICKKDFYQQEHLRAHVRHHNNERPFQCEVCSKSFNIKSSLQRHMNCHTGAKPFICNLCHRGYTRRSVLMLHIQQVHENRKPYQCSECQTCFSQKGNLQAHFRRKHLQPKLDMKREAQQREKVKRTVQRQSLKQTPKIPKLNPIKSGTFMDSSVNNHITKIIPNDVFIPLSIIKTEPKVQDNPKPALATVNNVSSDTPSKSIRLSDADKNVVNCSEDPSHFLNKLNAVAAENNEFFRFLTNCEDNFSNSNGGFPSLLDSGPTTNEQLSLPDDLKLMCDLDLFNDPNDWEDFLLSDSDILNPYDSEILSSPTKFLSNPIVKTEIEEPSSLSTKPSPSSSNDSDDQHEFLVHPISLCHHDYASPHPPENELLSIPSNCSRTSPIKKNIQANHGKKRAKHDSPSKKSITFSLYKERKLHLTTPPIAI